MERKGFCLVRCLCQPRLGRLGRQCALGTVCRRGSWQASARESGDPDVVKTDQGSFDPGPVKSFLDVGECNKSVHVTAETQRVEDAERHGIGAPKKTTLGHVPTARKCAAAMRAWTRCSKTLKAQDASVLERKESREVGSPSRLMTGTTRLDLQRPKKERSRWRHQGKWTLKAEYGRPSAPGADS